MEIGLIRKIDIDQEMQQAYLDYAMSVIVARALPDARDGLKPVHRRILYAMYAMGLRPDTSYRKSARVVGDVLGKYHPHSDSAVYDAMARMAQDFSMRHTLVDGQGNFGSMDGDPPAAMRYTEARLALPAMDILADIGKDTVDFSANFDDTMTEPQVLPAAIPNMLVNGSTGIAVGMSTNIPPHNLGEVVDALNYMLERWTKLDDINVEDLMQFISGPDFPTGGVIIRAGEDDDLAKAYGSGRGRVTVQARTHLEEMDRNRNRIIISELPYATNKSSLIERIANLVRDGKLEGITDLRDESDRHGMRIVIELTRNVDPEDILRELYRRTPMRNRFSIIMLALVNGEPRMLSLKQALRVYLDHRLVVVRRRSEYELNKAKERAHILEGLQTALDNLDEIIITIRKSRTVETAHQNLRREFKLSKVQTQAILDMPLRRLAALERRKIEEEYKELKKRIRALQSLLKSSLKLRKTVAEELAYVKEAYADRRRTQIATLAEGEAPVALLTADDLIPAQNVWVAALPDGKVSRILDGKQPRVSGKIAPKFLIKANTRDTLYLAAADGTTAAIPIHSIPEVENATEGTHYAKLSPLAEKDELTVLFSLPAKDELDPEWFVFTATRAGMVKKSGVDELPGPSAQTFPLVKVKEGDRLGWVRLTSGTDEIIMAANGGMAIRFSEEDVRPMGLLAAGVMGMKLKAGQTIIGMDVIDPEGEVFLLLNNGLAKRVKAGNFPTQGRYGQGVAAWKLDADEELVGLGTGKGTTKAGAQMMKLAPKTVRFDEAPIRTRPAKGKEMVEPKEGGGVAGLMVPWEPPRPIKPLEKSKRKPRKKG